MGAILHARDVRRVQRRKVARKVDRGFIDDAK
jgi:hypothetical protein